VIGRIYSYQKMDVRSDCEADSLIPSPLKPEKDSGTQDEVIEAHTR
jgi:hypothetical protein